MDRKEQLEYCRKCKNKAFDLEKGIICGLSGKAADFEKNCEYFEEKIKPQSVADEEEELDLSEIKRIFKLFLKGKFVITPLILIACVYLFFKTLANNDLFLQDQMSLIKYGAGYKGLTVNGQYWRLITQTFLHLNLLHLIMNLYALFSVGFLLERIVGSWKFALIYLLAGIGASSASVYFGSAAMSIGASGAIYGLFGVYIMLLTTDIMDKQTRLIVSIAIGAYVLFGIFTNVGPRIDVAAHIGGLVSGLLLGLGLRPLYLKRHREKPLLKILSFTSFILLLLFSSSYLVYASKTPDNQFLKVMYDFQLEEDEALKVFEKYRYRDIETCTKMTTGNVMPRFRKCRRLASEAASLDGLSKEVEEAGNLLVEYCDYSLKFFELELSKRLKGVGDVGLLLEYVNNRKAHLQMILNGFISRDSVELLNPMEEFLNYIPQSSLVFLDYEEVQQDSNFLKLDPLSFTSSARIPRGMVPDSVDLQGNDYAFVIFSREAIVRRINEMPGGFRKNQLKKVYNIKE